ncbi:hypothetical protein BX600DRAFT_533363 [Xylariales sp. PMI_506]|nr:hypothetical protein BX600DRAFT_533363 [Xylariales sp. PMI_506]
MEFKSSEELYLLIKAVGEKRERLDANAAKYLRKLLLNFRRQGHGVLDHDEIQQYTKRQLQIKDLERQYNQNIRVEDGALYIPLADLDGVPQESIDRLSGEDVRRGRPSPEVKCPDELLEGIVQSRNQDRAFWYLSQLACSQFDLKIHHMKTHDECVNLDLTRVYNDTMFQLNLWKNIDQEDQGHGQSDFGHIMAGYDAGYYSYLRYNYKH